MLYVAIRLTLNRRVMLDFLYGYPLSIQLIQWDNLMNESPVFSKVSINMNMKKKRRKKRVMVWKCKDYWWNWNHYKVQTLKTSKPKEHKSSPQKRVINRTKEASNTKLVIRCLHAINISISYMSWRK